MTLDQFREQMNRYRRRASEEAAERGDSFLVLDRLHDLYRRCDPAERTLADEVLSEWILSDDSSLRFDAMALSREFGISSVVPALERAAGRLEQDGDPGSRAEGEAVADLARELVASRGLAGG